MSQEPARAVEATFTETPSSARGETFQEPPTYTFYDDDSDSESGDGSESEYHEEIEEGQDDGSGAPDNVVDLVAERYEDETEAQKRKERRHEKLVRDREGDRRRREGLPRNYLKVDQFTGKPYGVGVSDWRKEVMLLSQKLDPAIGVINQQPRDAILEIAEWIQHTWEYSHPLKFEIVKEVIARGVSLRRASLWKKIKAKFPKPDDVSDRTWRSLKRELENPANIKKSVDCSKANASRVNFGRT